MKKSNKKSFLMKEFIMLAAVLTASVHTAKAENIQVSEEAVDAEIKKMAEAYKIEPEKMKEYLGDAEKENITMDLKVQEAVDFLVAEAKLV